MFFKLYPEGKIVVIQNHRDYFRISRRFKGAYTAAQTPWPDLKKDFTKGFLTLDDWQSVSVLDYTRVVIDLFCYMFYPFVSGFQANQLGLTFLLVFDPPERYEPPAFPSDWLAIPRSHSEFGEEDFDRKAALLEPKGAVAEHAGHQKYLHTKAFSAAEIVDLLRWFVEAGNRLFFELTDLTNFTAGFVPTGPIDPIFAFEHSITIDRMIRKTLGAMLLYEISSAKATVFEVADLYDANSELFSGTGKTEFFKTLFDTKDGLALIRSQLATLPIPFADYFQGLATELYGELEQTILESVWLKSKVGSAGVSVRNKALTGENVEPSNKFVANVMRALRNAHHGYFSSGAPQKGPSRYLFPITGNVPDSITALPTLWLLAYLANPKLTGWNHLEVSHYD
jgi:hypothetical protein